MNNRYFIIACVLLCLAVVLGAMGAHALKDKLDMEQRAVYETAVKYQVYHALALMILSFNIRYFELKRLKISMLLMLLGIILFSGSLYSLSTLHICGMESLKPILGPITPIGGVSFIIAWIMLIFSLKKSDYKEI